MEKEIMGRNSRAKIQKDFDEKIVIEKYFSVINTLK